MKTITFIDNVALTVFGFTVLHALLLVLIIFDHVLIDQISLHYSNGLLWYILYHFIPLAFGLLVAFAFRNNHISKGVRILLYSMLTLQIAFQVTAITVSSNYWGYAFKRPTVFSEASQADNMITFSSVTTDTDLKPISLSVVHDTSNHAFKMTGKKDPYYGASDRILMVFEDYSHIHGHLDYFPEIYEDSTKKIEHSKLITISNTIYNSALVDTGEKSWEVGISLSGVVIEFQTGSKERYIFVGLYGKEISNDHYPFYEFLFKEGRNGLELQKKQRFYYDVAGAEGMEYTFISPLFSLLLAVLSAIGSIPSLGIWFFKERKRA